MGWGIIGDAFEAVGDAVSGAVDAVGDGLSSAWDWTRDHWKEIAIAVAATAVFVGVTALTGGLGAPALLAFAAGGFASGVAGYGLSTWLYDQPFDWRQALTAGVTGAAVSAATFGVARFASPALAGVGSRAASSTVVAAVPAGVRTGVVNTAAGAAFGGGARVVQNALHDRPLGEGVGDSAIVGGLTGAVTAPLMNVVPNLGAVRTHEDPIPAPPHAPSPTRGLIGALDDAPRGGSAGGAPPPPPSPEVVARGAGAHDYGLIPGQGGVEPLSPIPPTTRTVLDSWHAQVADYRAPRPLVLTDDQLAVLAPGRGAPSHTLHAGDASDLGNWSSASRLVNDYVRTGADLTSERIAEINRTLLRGTNNDAHAGVFRSQSGAEVGHYAPEGFYYYASPSRVPSYLDDFFAWYRANEGRLPPTELAAASYQQLVRIHPFVDSNGRTTRLVMDWILQRNGLPPATWGTASSEAVHSTTDWVIYNVDRGVIESGHTLATRTSDSTATMPLPVPPRIR